MKKKNYVSLIVGCFVCAVACTLPATAQENARYPFHPSQEQPQPQTFDPQQAAERITNEMKTTLQLTDKQYKKIYKLNLKEQKRMYENKTENDRPPMNDWFGEGPGPKGMPPMEMEHRPMQPAQSSHTVDQESIRKEKAAKEKKIKKILTSEQFEKWQKMQNKLKEKHSGKEPVAYFPETPERF